MSDIMKHARTN